MTFEASLKEIEIKLLSAPDFSEYDGGSAFIFQEKIYQQCGSALGNGAYGQVFLFRSDDGKKLVVKSELAFENHYAFGKEFKNEAFWYEKIYGLGVFCGDERNCSEPHYILMPYFEGKTLYSLLYHSTKEVLFCWIKTADAVNRLHEEHKAVHCDLKSDNIIFGNWNNQKSNHKDHDKAFIIDFGMTTQIGAMRNPQLEANSENKKRFTQYAPELFSKCNRKKPADTTQDIYSLGILLGDMQYRLKTNNTFFLHDAINEVKINLTAEDPRDRWSISKAIFMIVTTFFSQIPQEIWTTVTDCTILDKLHYKRMMYNIWRLISAIAIEVRCNDLIMEEKKLEKKGKESEIKCQKIAGLTLLQSKIRIQDPELLEKTIKEVKIKFPHLTAGIFSQRTKRVINQLKIIAPVFYQ